GVDERLVFVQARGRRAESMLHSGKSARRTGVRKLRSLPTEHQDSAQGSQRRLASLRAELLPPLPAGSAARAADRYLDAPYCVSLHHPGKGNVVKKTISFLVAGVVAIGALASGASAQSSGSTLTEADA